MITKRDWQEYSKQVALYNDIQLEKSIMENKKLQEERKKDMEAARKRNPQSLYFPSFSYIRPVLKKKTVENCLDWMIEGKPTLAKKIEVK